MLDITEKFKPKIIPMKRLTVWTITNYGRSKFGNVENNKFIPTLIFHETSDEEFGKLSVWLVSVTISGVCFRLLSKKLGISPRQLTSKDQPSIFFIFNYIFFPFDLFIIDFVSFYIWFFLYWTSLAKNLAASPRNSLSKTKYPSKTEFSHHQAQSLEFSLRLFDAIFALF